MTQDPLHQNLTIADAIAKKHNISTLDLILLSINTLEAFSETNDQPVCLKKVKKAVRMGAKALSEQEKTVSFHTALEACIKAKAHRRQRTLQEIRYFTNRILKEVKGIKNRSVRSFRSEEWERIIFQVFTTPRQQNKARILLHGIFAYAQKRGWCQDNPLSPITTPPVKETVIRSLSLKEAKELIDKARSEENGECLVPLALMLYAGIRPNELQRLTWHNIDLDNHVISLNNDQAKTGGARQITMEPVLHRILKQEFDRLSQDENFLRLKEKTLQRIIFKLRYQSPEATQIEEKVRSNWESYIPICPKNWTRKWSDLRQSAGWSLNGDKESAWSQDCLRHTFATFHILYYKDFTRLQYEMGHRSSQLLRSRYINTKGLTPADAISFWEITPVSILDVIQKEREESTAKKEAEAHSSLQNEEPPSETL